MPISTSIRGSVHSSIRPSLLCLLSSCYYLAYLLLFGVAMIARNWLLSLVFLLHLLLIQALKQSTAVKSQSISLKIHPKTSNMELSLKADVIHSTTSSRVTQFLQASDLWFRLLHSPTCFQRTPLPRPLPNSTHYRAPSRAHGTTTAKTAAEIRKLDSGRCNCRILVQLLMLHICDWVSIADLLKQILKPTV